MKTRDQLARELLSLLGESQPAASRSGAGGVIIATPGQGSVSLPAPPPVMVEDRSIINA